MEKILVALVLCITSIVFGQNKDQNLFDGTKEYEGKEYVKSESNLRVSQSNNADKKAVANYNLGNSIYRQSQPSEAKYKFASAAEVGKTKEEKHKAFHNLGNTLMLEKNYAGAVEAYKNALRNNPYDEETRYNYALAKKKQKENPPKDDKNKDKDKDKDKKDDQDKKDQDKKDKKDDKDKDKKGGDDKKDKSDKGDEDKKEQPKPSGANKQQIENLLNAVNNSEQKIQDKINAKKVKAQPITNEKDW